MTNSPIGVHAGQLWTSTHRSDQGRVIRIDQVDDLFAYTTVVTPSQTSGSPDTTGRKSRIRIAGSGLGLSGYRLHEDAPQA